MEKHLGHPPFKLLHFFSIASLLSILVIAVAMTLYYRHMSVNTIIELGETINLTLARATLNSIKPHLSDYLVAVTEVGPGAMDAAQIPGDLEKAIRKLIRETAIVRIKIYNWRGVVVYSTKPEQIGRDQSDNPGFKQAITGQMKSKLIYRDSFNVFDRETAEDNLIQSYLPIGASPYGPVLGVFEIYTDVNHLVHRTERTWFLMLPGIFAIFLLLYIALILIVRKAELALNRQQDIIRERTNSLEVLSAQLLSTQEDERKRIATALHEGVAQTLSAVKLRVENACRDHPPGDAGEAALASVVPLIQDAIGETRSLAMHLRPSSLDDFGIVEALEWFLRDLRALFPKLGVRAELEVREQDIARPLKTIIYRIVQDTLNNLATRTEADQVQLSLRRTNHSIELVVDENGRDYGLADDDRKKTGVAGGALATMRERTLLSGGEFHTERKASGGTRNVSRWAA